MVGLMVKYDWGVVNVIRARWSGDMGMTLGEQEMGGCGDVMNKFSGLGML